MNGNRQRRKRDFRLGVSRSAQLTTWPRLAGLAVIAAMAVFGAAAAARSTTKHGIYSSVRESRNTGDLGGLEIEFVGGAQIETTLCEGWCNWLYRTGYEVRGSIVYYELREELTDQDGNKSINIIPISLKPSGKNWLAKVSDDGRWSVLKRLPRPFGLAIAKEQMSAKN